MTVLHVGVELQCRIRTICCFWCLLHADSRFNQSEKEYDVIKHVYPRDPGRVQQLEDAERAAAVAKLRQSQVFDHACLRTAALTNGCSLVRTQRIRTAFGGNTHDVISHAPLTVAPAKVDPKPQTPPRFLSEYDSESDDDGDIYIFYSSVEGSRTIRAVRHSLYACALHNE